MSEWRRQAMATFPDRVGVLHRATSLHDLWFTLLQDLQGGYRNDPPAHELIGRIWDFATWCFAASRHHSVRNAVAVSFFEHLPHFGPARRDLPHKISREMFLELLPAFRTTLTETECPDFVEEFLLAQGASPAEIHRVKAAAS